MKKQQKRRARTSETIEKTDPVALESGMFVVLDVELFNELIGCARGHCIANAKIKDTLDRLIESPFSHEVDSPCLALRIPIGSGGVYQLGIHQKVIRFNRR